MQLNPSEISELLKSASKALGSPLIFAPKVPWFLLPTVFAAFTVFLT